MTVTISGLMQDSPLLISSLIDHAALNHGTTGIVSRDAGGRVSHGDWATVADHARRVAALLGALGVTPGDRVASLAWNSQAHLELYFGVTGAGAVLHTVNPRLFPEQLRYILDHGESRWLFVDPALLDVAEALWPTLRHAVGAVVLCDADAMPVTTIPNALCYGTLLADTPPIDVWPQFDENAASTLCYTSGTTGNPKGVLYSHRSTVLHAFCGVATDGMGLSARDTILLVTPLFHVNAWGAPFSAAMCGARLVLPGPRLDGASLFSLLAEERCTFSLGVPTVWLGLLDHIDAEVGTEAREALALERVLVGGSAAPRALIERFDRTLGVELVHAWGMTETSPLATVNRPLSHHAALDAVGRYALGMHQGRSLYGVELRLTDEDGAVAVRDGVASGELQIRGPWIVRRYFGEDSDACAADGWFATGDVARLTPDGYLTITDRSKDVIKSGGEWISSIDLENAAMAHPHVAEAAVVGIPHPRWQERPLLLVRLHAGRKLDRAAMLDHLAGHVARWWLPDDILAVGDLPHTATGKLLKAALRTEYRDHYGA